MLLTALALFDPALPEPATEILPRLAAAAEGVIAATRAHLALSDADLSTNCVYRHNRGQQGCSVR